MTGKPKVWIFNPVRGSIWLPEDVNLHDIEWVRDEAQAMAEPTKRERNGIRRTITKRLRQSKAEVRA